MRPLTLPYLCSVLTFILLFLFGYAYVRVAEENSRLDHMHVLDSRIEQQISSITHALFQAETPLRTLAAMLQVRRGHFEDFETYAAHLLRDNPLVDTLFLVPDGVVRVAYPLHGNEAAMGHDLLNDPHRRAEVMEAIASNGIVLAGPVSMRQGGLGLFARKPVFWEENGEPRLWGLVAAKIPWENIVAAFEFDQLAADGYAYRLTRKLATDSAPVIIARSGDVVDERAAHKTLAIPGGQWRLDISYPSQHGHLMTQIGLVGVTLAAALVALLVFHVLRGRERLLAQTEALVGANVLLEREIAWRSQVEEELRDAKERAEEATHAKSDFLALMSHELRTPMNGVYGMLQLLDMTSLDDEQKDYVRTGSTALKSLLDLINDILDFSKIEAGRMEIAETTFEIAEIYRSLPGIFRAQTMAKKLRLDIVVSENVPGMLCGDPGRIRQILINLVGNAIKFTERGGVDVHISAVDSTQKNGAVRLLVAVRDTGPGIPEDQLGKLFQPFTQAKDALLRTESGTGLGLSIVKRLVELMNGEVDMESAVGVGTTVRFSLPLREPGDHNRCLDSVPEQEGCMASGKSGLTVLVAEDDPITQTMLSSVLRKLGCDPVCVNNGQDAVAKMREVEADLVLMDIQMPIMDGMEATRRIREDASLADRSRIPIVAVTAFAMSGDRERFLAAGMDDYLPKPVNMKDLKVLLERLET